MRIKNLRIHLVAIAIVCLVVLVVYATMHRGGGLRGGVPVETDRAIQIDSATWGRNCDSAVDDALRTWQPPKTPEEFAARPKPHRAIPDNALVALSNRCNGKLTCSFRADSTTMEDDPLPSCFKRLSLRYRCFSYDRLVMKEIEQGEQVTLDCVPKQSPPVEER